MESRGGSTSRRGGRRLERSRRSAPQLGWCVRLLLRVEVLALSVHALTIPYTLQVSCARSSTLPPPKFSSPFLPSLAFSPAQAARGRFRQRFEWLNRLPQLDGAVQGAAADWAAYRGERDRLDELEVRAVPLFAQPSLSAAALMLGSLLRQPSAMSNKSEKACERAVLALIALERVLPALRGMLSLFQALQQVRPAFVALLRPLCTSLTPFYVRSTSARSAASPRPHSTCRTLRKLGACWPSCDVSACTWSRARSHL